MYPIFETSKNPNPISDFHERAKQIDAVKALIAARHECLQLGRLSLVFFTGPADDTMVDALPSTHGADRPT